MGISAVSLDDRHPMTEMFDVVIAEQLRIAGGRLDGDLLIAMVERRDRLCGDELEDDGIGSVFPAEHGAEDDQDEHIEDKDVIPYGFVDAVRDIHRDEVCPAGRSICLQGQGDGQPVEKSAERDVEDDIVQDRLKLHRAQ